MDPHSIDIARHYPLQKTPDYVYNRCYETAKKIYTPAVHPVSRTLPVARCEPALST